MIEDTSPISALDILGADLTNVDSTYPVLQVGVVDFVVSDIKTEPTKKGNGHNLTISLKTAMSWNTREGAPRAPGHVIRDNIFLPSGSAASPEAVAMAKQKVAAFKEAVTGSKAGSFGSPDQYIGKPVTARIKIETSADYGDSNRVQAYVRR